MTLDPTGRANGRGAYLCRDAVCWTGALRRGTLDRALASVLPDDLRATLTAGPDHMIMDTNETNRTPVGAEASGEGSGGAPHGTK